jgi:hypothetical protein
VSAATVTVAAARIERRTGGMRLIVGETDREASA